MPVKGRWCIVALLCLCFYARAQDSAGTSLANLLHADKFIEKVNRKSLTVQVGLSRNTAYYISRLAQQESRIHTSLAKRNKVAADQLFAGGASQYQALLSRLVLLKERQDPFRNDYIGHLDSLQTACKYLGQLSLPDQRLNPSAALARLQNVQDRFNQASVVNRWLQERQAFLRQGLARYGLSDKLSGWTRQLGYYRMQVESYKQAFEDMDKLESVVMRWLSESNTFQKFFLQHSDLARLFQLPGSSSSSGALAGASGLQTNAMLEEAMNKKLGRTIDPVNMAQENAAGNDAPLNDLKARAARVAGKSSDEKAMPGINSNPQHGRKFLQRLEWGGNVQSSRPNSLFPVTTDLAGTIGYKINGRSIAGIGMSYKLGWGRDIRHLHFSSEGIGLRAFMDWRMKGSFWLSGGAEANYLNRIRELRQVMAASSWQKGALVGIMKKYKVSSRISGRIQLLYDFLWRQQSPAAQPVVFRMGYNF